MVACVTPQTTQGIHLVSGRRLDLLARTIYDAVLLESGNEVPYLFAMMDGSIADGCEVARLASATRREFLLAAYGLSQSQRNPSGYFLCVE